MDSMTSPINDAESPAVDPTDPDITFAISDQIMRQNAPNVDPSALMLRALWEIICEENDTEMHLVSESEREQWIDMRDDINRRLESEDLDNNEIVRILYPIAKALNCIPETGSTHSQYTGTRYKGMFHGKVRR